MCKDCGNTGYITETNTAIYDGGYLPEYTEIRCRCNPEPTDDDTGYPGETPYPDFDVVDVDYDKPITDYALPAHLLA